ncbi:MAG: TetR family transcriptional regulator [Streptosporangiaceae bacterium]
MAPTQAETQRSRLSKATVVHRALALADDGGLDALTIRRLAQELGVTPMALYWHFRNKEELLAGLADQIWSEISTHTDPAAPWHAQLRGIMESLIAVLRAHPSASELLIAAEKNNSPPALVVTEAALQVLHQAGFDPRQASEVARNGLWTGLTLAISEPGRQLAGNEAGRAGNEAGRAEQQRRAMARLAMLPPDRYPRVVEAAVPLTACDDPGFHYRFGIDLFISGVRAMASRAAESPGESG